MKTMFRALFGATAMTLVVAPLHAQETQVALAGRPSADTTAPAAAAPAKPALVFQSPVDRIRPSDQRGINVFETPKASTVPFTGPTLRLGAAFTQQFQGLEAENTAAPRLVNNVDQNRIVEIGSGFNLAAANLYIDAQLAKGIRVSLESYMSSRGHSEFWVKGGYLQIDESPFDTPVLNTIMKYTTIKAGHFENNYGDAHFRRSDNGQAMYNPFVGNYIMDAFTTEIGGEVYLRSGPWMLMGALSSGEVKGAVAAPEQRGLAKYGKAGFDHQVNEDLRLRLTGSYYTTDKSLNQTLFSGDRAGSRYYEVIVNKVGGDRWSGSIQPGFRNSVSAVQVNPFVKFRGLELFGVIEQAQGKTTAEASDRKMNQYAGDVVYRFLDDKLYLGGRYNTVTGRLANTAAVQYTEDITVNRTQFGGGWFITPLVLTKLEYVTQTYNDFPSADIRNGGKFSGFMIEGVVAF